MTFAKDDSLEAAPGRLSVRFNAPSAGYYLQRLDRQGQTDAGCWSTEVRVEATGSPAAIPRPKRPRQAQPWQCGPCRHRTSEHARRPYCGE